MSFYLIVVLIFSFTALVSCRENVSHQPLPDRRFEEQLGEQIADCLREESGLPLKKWGKGKGKAKKWLRARLETYTHQKNGLPALRGNKLVVWELDDESNYGAFLLPGGQLLVGKGLLSCIISAEEAEALLIHLMAHEALRHPLQLLLHDFSLSRLEQVVFRKNKRLCTVLAMSALSTGYPEFMERQADSLAADWGLFCLPETDSRAALLAHCLEESGDDDLLPVTMLHPALQKTKP